MEYSAFAECFPEIAQRETRVLTVSEESAESPPIGRYAFMEMFCRDPDCDCRNALILVVKYGEEDSGGPMTGIRFCWERESFYKSIHMDFSPYCHKYPSAFLDPMVFSGLYDEYFLKLFNSMSYDSGLMGRKEETSYAKRIQKHYEMFKAHFRKSSLEKRIIEKKFEIDRNARCSCGSQIKYKKCCGSLSRS